jgi:hypothetical protein
VHELVIEALKPAKLRKIEIDETNHRVRALVDAENLPSPSAARATTPAWPADSPAGRSTSKKTRPRLPASNKNWNRPSKPWPLRSASSSPSPRRSLPSVSVPPKPSVRPPRPIWPKPFPT